MSNKLETHTQTFFVNSGDVVPEHAAFAEGGLEGKYVSQS
jgi:hypothetical protein